jgi:predicted nucleotidyltransferase
MLNEDFNTFVRLCEEIGVEYMIVGGYAVAIHGYPRFTGDIDIWYRQTKINCSKIIEVVAAFGFASLQLSVDDLMEPEVIIQFGRPPRRIDLVSTIDGINFDDAFPRAITLVVDDVSIKIISKPDLIINKSASGRHKDLDDIENLG